MENIFAVNIDKNGKINKSKYIKEGECIFPFKYKKKEVNECQEGKRGLWCATSLKDNQSYNTYGYCPETDKQKLSSQKMIKSKKSSSSESVKKSKKKSSSVGSDSFLGSESKVVILKKKNIKNMNY